MGLGGAPTPPGPPPDLNPPTAIGLWLPRDRAFWRALGFPGLGEPPRPEQAHAIARKALADPEMVAILRRLGRLAAVTRQLKAPRYGLTSEEAAGALYAAFDHPRLGNAETRG